VADETGDAGAGRELPEEAGATEATSITQPEAVELDAERLVGTDYLRAAVEATDSSIADWLEPDKPGGSGRAADRHSDG